MISLLVGARHRIALRIALPVVNPRFEADLSATSLAGLTDFMPLLPWGGPLGGRLPELKDLLCATSIVCNVCGFTGL
jgi:hypothetical protein